MPIKFKRARGVYGTPWSKLAKVEVTPEILSRLGACLVQSIVAEGMVDFAKRGWSLNDPMGGPSFQESWTYQVSGRSTLEILSSWYGMVELTRDGIPSRKMWWISQEAKDRHPERYHLTRTEKRLGMKQGGRVSKGERLPLVVPIKDKGTGRIVLRMAPSRMQDAWIHPGIAKFSFLERGIRKGRKRCADIIQQEVIRILAEGDPLR